MIDFENKSVALIGFGISNRGMCDYLTKRGIYPTVRAHTPCQLPQGVTGVFGQDCLLTEEDIVIRSPVIRPDRIRAKGIVTSELEISLEGCSGFKIGVTGSDGKTTVSTLIYRMLISGGKNAFLGGNIGRALINISPMVSESDFVVAEVSSFQLMDYCPCLDVGVLTGITPNHLDWHRDMAEYTGAKGNILKNAKRQVVCYDNETAREMAGENSTLFSLTDLSHLVGRGHTLVYIKDGWVYYDYEALFPVSHICLRGQFNVQNVLCAVGAVYPTVGKDGCYRVAREFCGVEERQELVDTINGVSFISSSIDTTPSRTIATLSALDLHRTVVILGGYDKNLSYGELGRVLSGAKALVLCGENREKIEKSTQNPKIIGANTLGEAVRIAYGLCAEGDTVILSPASASFDMFKNYKERGRCFKQSVRELREENRRS